MQICDFAILNLDNYQKNKIVLEKNNLVLDSPWKFSVWTL